MVKLEHAEKTPEVRRLQIVRAWGWSVRSANFESRLFQIEIPRDDSRSDRIHVIGGFIGTFSALRATKIVLFDCRKFAFVGHPAEVIPFKVCVGNVVHAGTVRFEWKSSQQCYLTVYATLTFA
jgi:hypothetical protein